MTVREVSQKIEERFYLGASEDFDNVGLLCGNLERKVSGILICHDAVEESVDEAILENCNFILCFHPIIFSGLKSLTGRNYVERSVIKAIENKIAIYAIHTALDNDFFGINYDVCEKLGLKNQQILMPKQKKLMQLSVFVPNNSAEALKSALFEAKAGEIGFYDRCSFSIQGEGSFRPKEGANPFIGIVNKEERVGETMVSVIFESYKKEQVLQAMRRSHPYEEIAYFLYSCENENKYQGLGRFGELEKEMNETDFLNFVKNKFNLNVIRHSRLSGKKLKKIGILAGSGSSGIKNAIHYDCDAYLTGDLKYHDFFHAEEKILLIDIGHYESEQFIMDFLYKFLSEKITNFTVLKLRIKTNPVNYFL